MQQKVKPITLFETIKVEDGKIFNLKWHNQRFNKSRQALFKTSNSLNLQEHISPPKSGLYRCKITYNTSIQSVEYFSYQAKTFESFKIVQSQIDYQYKYSDRFTLEQLKVQDADEIIIEKDGLLTDTSIANIAFFKDNTWITPAKPLLEGTTRARLLSEGFLQVGSIKKEDVQSYSHFALMNAMIGFRIQKSVCLRM